MTRATLIFVRGLAAIAVAVLLAIAVITFVDLKASGYPLTGLVAFDFAQARFVADLTNRGLNQLLALAFTVVAIAVPLTANLYSLKFLDFFVTDRVNAAVLSLVVISDLASFWAVFSIKQNYIPFVQLYVDFALLILCLCVLFPYLLYVFRFLHPNKLLHRLEHEIEAAVRTAARQPARAAGERRVVVEGIEHIANIAVRSIDRTDRATAIESIFTFERVVRAYWTLKPGLPPAWFVADPNMFRSFSSKAVAELTAKHTWVEMIFFWQLRGVLSAAVPRTHDVAGTAARALRHLGMSEAARNDGDVRELVVDYFNTFIRLALSRRDPHTTFALFDHYRLLAETLNADYPNLVLEIAYYFEYYGQIARESGLTFLVKAAAHDLGALVQHAWETQAPNREKLFERFMHFDSMDRPRLPGVLKAQAILASYFLLAGQSAPAEQIRLRFTGIDPVVIADIRDDLLHIRRESYWEISERRENIDYVRPAQREKLKEFFESLK